MTRDETLNEIDLSLPIEIVEQSGLPQPIPNGLAV
jgi:hypothetical protein